MYPGVLFSEQCTVSVPWVPAQVQVHLEGKLLMELGVPAEQGVR